MTEAHPHDVRRYGLARLYDTTTRSYVDIAQLHALRQAGTPVTVRDAKTGEDITGSVLRPESPL